MLAADHTGVLAGLHELALGLVGFLPVDRGDDAILLVFELRIERIVLTQDDGDDGQVVLAGELEVALVAARDGHNRTGAVVGHDVVGDPHGDLLAVHRVHDIAAGERAVLLAVALGALDGAITLEAASTSAVTSASYSVPATSSGTSLLLGSQ